MRPVHTLRSDGFQARLLSPLGSYPAESFYSKNAALVVEEDICLSIVRWKEEEGFSEIDNLAPADIPILGTVLLCVERGQQPIYPYPTHQSILLQTSASQLLEVDTASEAAKWLRAFVTRHKLEYGVADSIHRPPAAGGLRYEVVASNDRNMSRGIVLSHLESADAVEIRGVTSLIKTNMAWRHNELHEAACVSLWIALDAAFSVILARLRNTGVQSPTAKDAADYLNRTYGILDGPEKFFEMDYENRIRFIHPESRFGAEARPWLLADDFYELNENLIDLFYFFATGIARDRQA